VNALPNWLRVIIFILCCGFTVGSAYASMKNDYKTLDRRLKKQEDLRDTIIEMRNDVKWIKERLK